MWLREYLRDLRAMRWVVESNVMGKALREASEGQGLGAESSREYATRPQNSAGFRAIGAARAMRKLRFRPAALTFS
jgi:hypothetical protein